MRWPPEPYDLTMAIGVEKLKDSGYSGLTGSGAPPSDGTESTMTAPATFSLLAPAYARKYGVDEKTLRRVLTHIAYKNTLQRREEPQGAISERSRQGKDRGRAESGGMLGVFDCSGVSDGAAAAILCRAEEAHKYTDRPIFIKALSSIAGPAEGAKRQGYDYTTFPKSSPAPRTPMRRRE